MLVMSRANVSTVARKLPMTNSRILQSTFDPVAVAVKVTVTVTVTDRLTFQK